MKLKYFCCLLGLLSVTVQAQTVPSSCNAPDSIRNRWLSDAYKLSIRQMTLTASPNRTRVDIPASETEPPLEALLAVYNSRLPARDSVVFLKIHALKPILSYFDFYTHDTTWMNRWIAGDSLTNDPALDTFFTKYGLKFRRFYDYRSFLGYGGVSLTATRLLHLKALQDSMQLQLTQRRFFDANSNFMGDGHDITYQLDAQNNRILTYSFGDGDCPSGCTIRRFWEFKVFADCRVTFVRSYGSPIRVTLPNPTEEVARWAKVYPNPATDVLHLELQHVDAQCITLLDVLGNIVFQQPLRAGQTHFQIPLAALSTGLYFYQVRFPNAVATGKFYKTF